MTKVEELLEQAKSLSAGDRAKLLAELHDLVMPRDPAWEKAWADECERRAAMLDRGESTAEDAAVVMRRLREKFIPG